MRDSLAKLQQQSPMSEQEIKVYELELFEKTGKALIHPNDFAEMYVREAIKKHIDNKFRKGKQ